MNMSFKKLILLPLIFSGCTLSQAEPYNAGYIVGSISDVDYENSSGDKLSDNGYSLGVGKYINNRFSVEAGYADFGEVGPFEATALQLSVIGYLPVSSRIGFFGRAGVDFIKIEHSPTGIESDTETNPYFGIGGFYNLTDNLDFRLEYQKHEITSDVDAETLNAGFSFNTF